LRAAIARCEAELSALEDFLDKHTVASQSVTSTSDATVALEGYLERANPLLARYRTVRAYIFAHVATDAFDQRARRLLSEIEPLGVRLHQIDVRFGAG